MVVKDNKMGLWGAVSIGVGGMVGGGIFAVLGLSVQLAGGGTPVAFALAGLVALVTASSYARLSVRYAGAGGTVVFLDRIFGNSMHVGALNVLLWFSYVVMLALYAHAFGSYGAVFFPENTGWLVRHGLISLAIIVPAVLNLTSAKVVGKAETYVVVVKISILLFFLVVGVKGVEPARLAPDTWVPMLPLVAGGMIIFVAYEGFELIANTGAEIRDPERDLPLAFYLSVGFVILLYVAIAVVVVGNLPLDAITGARDYALAEAARPFLGRTGFTLIAVAALLSTFSAINATLYGSSRLCYTIAKEGELPVQLERQMWGAPAEGLLVTSALALILANVGDLSFISTLGSAGFLSLFAVVNAANFKDEDAGAGRTLSALGVVACAAAFGAMVWQSVGDDPANVWVLAALFGGAGVLEVTYRTLGTKGPRKRRREARVTRTL
ncbi:APC family permease [Pseudodesulfovibrio thermohalotolerans]|uniref:APC family permease n=1 Tax=Pseudodesulfovibrio thermohalotolerans TaxID=2880651 RepID=UPI0024435D9F|nr:APC family permease [Pseudodesulfovibrio thermohalotolerans]WFS61191.1 APC family permease [Pseudodesulfovibrio thermohalotolerans]